MDYKDPPTLSFLCSFINPQCTLCHASCNCDGAGVCTSCKDPTLTPDPLLNACHCSGNKGTSGGIYSVTCAVCDGSCSTCNLAGNPNSCLTCPAGHLPISNVSGGTCVVIPCVITNIIPGTTCDPCPNNCPYCVDSDPASCMSKPEVDFALTAASLYGLPKLSEQNGSVCYRIETASNDKNRCALESVVGTLAAGTITLSTAQCYKLLHAQWAFMTYWFSDLFSTFAPPGTASDTEKLKIKTTLQLWIIQFSPIRMKTDPDWQSLVAAFNTAGADWGKYLGWTGTPGRYTLNGSTRKVFPEELSAWLRTDARDLAALNMKSTVCNTAGCGFAHECWSVNPSLACSVAP